MKKSFQNQFGSSISGLFSRQVFPLAKRFLPSRRGMGAAVKAGAFSLALSMLSVWALAGEAIDVKVNAGKVLNPIDLRVYGHFLEHIYNSCNGGLWGELVWNRSLEVGNAQSWSLKNDAFVQSSVQGNSFMQFGDENWTDYELTLDAKKVDGVEGFLILFRASKENYYWANLGGWKNKEHGIECIRGDSKMTVGKRVSGEIQGGENCQIRVRVEGNRFQVFLNGKSVLDVVDENAIRAGKIGIGTWDTAAEFRNIQVKDLQGKVLYDFEAAQKNVNLKADADIRFWETNGNHLASSGQADSARNGEKFVRFTAPGFMAQKNFAFQAGENYDFSYWVRGAGEVTLNGQKSAFQSKEWKKIHGTFTVAQSTKDGVLRLECVPTGGALDIDQISIMPRSWKENYHGMRPDLLQAIREIQPPVIRWPGGCFASAYRWKSGIGPQDDRESFPVEMWNDREVNSFGIDEFMQLCREVGAEPIMVVNIGTKQWSWTRDGEEIDLQEAVDWVEYCNGSADTKWGAVRAKNGHPEPYGVKYWEIDNEVHPVHTPVDEYVAVCSELIPRMKAVDPNIQIIACGSWNGGDKFAWDENVGVRVNGISYLSTHRYDNPDGYASNPYQNQRFFEDRRQILEKSGNSDLRFFHSEWNAQCTDWRTGLHAGGILNCFEKVGDVLTIAAPALFLRHTSATGWDNAFINFDHTGWFPAPNYVVMKLWRESYAPNRVQLLSTSPVMLGLEPIVNAVATRSEDGKTVYVKVVNNQMEEASMNISLADVQMLDASAQCVTPELAEGEEVKEKLRKRNTLAEPTAIAPKPLAVKKAKNQVQVVLPALSASVVKISVQ